MYIDKFKSKPANNPHKNGIVERLLIYAYEIVSNTTIAGSIAIAILFCFSIFWISPFILILLFCYGKIIQPEVGFVK
jgi:hypothetical protein